MDRFGRRAVMTGGAALLAGCATASGDDGGPGAGESTPTAAGTRHTPTALGSPPARRR